MVRDEINEKTAYIQARSSMAELWKSMGKHAKLKEKQKWSEESSILRTHENCEGSISTTPRIRNSKKPSRTRVRSWKHQWLLLCPVKLSKIVGVVHPTKLRQNLRVFWKLMNPQECVWEIRYRIIMKTILQEEETIHYSITIWFTIFLFSSYENSGRQRKQRWTRNGKLDNFCVELDETHKQERGDR